jgi:hypothetical protein
MTIEQMQAEGIALTSALCAEQLRMEEIYIQQRINLRLVYEAKMQAIFNVRTAFILGVK